MAQTTYITDKIVSDQSNFIKKFGKEKSNKEMLNAIIEKDLLLLILALHQLSGNINRANMQSQVRKVTEQLYPVQHRLALKAKSSLGLENYESDEEKAIRTKITSIFNKQSKNMQTEYFNYFCELYGVTEFTEEILPKSKHTKDNGELRQVILGALKNPADLNRAMIIKKYNETIKAGNSVAEEK